MTYQYRCVILYFDGASRWNPRGQAGCRWALYKMNLHWAHSLAIATRKKYLGHIVLNNQAEYSGLKESLKYIQANIECYNLYIWVGSENAICQLERVFKVKSDNIGPLYNEICNISNKIDCLFHKVYHIFTKQGLGCRPNCQKLDHFLKSEVV